MPHEQSIYRMCSLRRRRWTRWKVVLSRYWGNPALFMTRFNVRVPRARLKFSRGEVMPHGSTRSSSCGRSSKFAGPLLSQRHCRQTNLGDGACPVESTMTRHDCTPHVGSPRKCSRPPPSQMSRPAVYVTYDLESSSRNPPDDPSRTLNPKARARVMTEMLHSGSGIRDDHELRLRGIRLQGVQRPSSWSPDR